MAEIESLADGGTVYFDPDFIPKEEADLYFARLKEEIAWNQEIGRFNKPFPRLTAYCADEGLDYSYSGVLHRGSGWPELLQSLRQRVEQAAEAQFNSVLLNFYRDQTDSMGYHADDEPEMGENPVIGSLTFGAARTFLLRHNESKERRSYSLTHGSLLIMGGTLQHFWKHAIPKSTKDIGERINLTFRRMHRMSEK